MKSAETTQSGEVWERKTWGLTFRKGTLSSTLGLFLLISGVVLIAVGFGAWGIDSKTTGYSLLLGGLLAVVGAVLLTNRKGITINQRERTVCLWTKWLSFAKEKHRPLAEFESVCVRRETYTTTGGRKGRRRVHTHTVFAVWLIGIANDAHVVDHSTYEKARQDGEELARFIGMPLSDLTRDEEEVRAPDDEMPWLDSSSDDEVVRALDDGTPLPAPRGEQVIGAPINDFTSLGDDVPMKGQLWQKMLPKMLIGFVIGASLGIAFNLSERTDHHRAMAAKGRSGWVAPLGLGCLGMGLALALAGERAQRRNCPRCGASMGLPQYFQDFGSRKRASKQGKRVAWKASAGESKTQFGRKYKVKQPYYFCEKCDAEFLPEELPSD